MDEKPQRSRFRFWLITLFVVVVCAAILGVITRRTDPNLARVGMTKFEVWWFCGLPDTTDSREKEPATLWVYRRRDGQSAMTLFFGIGHVEKIARLE
jgi:hypothetical protein